MKIDHGLVKGEHPLFFAPLRGCLRCEPDWAASQRPPVLAWFAGRDRWEWSLVNANGVTYGHLLTQSLVNRVKVLAQAQRTGAFWGTCNAVSSRPTLNVHRWETVGRDIEV